MYELTVKPFDLVLFGGTGDLALRKLMPAMYLRHRAGQLPKDGRIIAVALPELSNIEYITKIKAAAQSYLRSGAYEENIWRSFEQRVVYISLDVTDSKNYSGLQNLFLGREGKERVFYLATKPDFFGVISQSLSDVGLVTAESRIVLEKPLGDNLKDVRRINDQVANVFSEKQIFRIDHYLGKETVQNLLVLRFANTLFESMWNARYIDHIQITIAEDIGVERRGEFYEKTGALRDMLQSHLLQLLCIVAMEPPTKVDADEIRNEKLKVLKALKPILEEDVSRVVARGQYAKGEIEEQKVPGYKQENSVNSKSETETFVAIKAEVKNWRWAGVPFYLRTGKRLRRRLCEIVIEFKDIPHSIFSIGEDQLPANKLVIHLQPDEKIELSFSAKKIGPDMDVRPMSLNLTQNQRQMDLILDDYERLLIDVLHDRSTLFVRYDEVEAAWRWVEPILSAWENQPGDLDSYSAGSWGTDNAHLLIESDGRSWHEDARKKL